MNTPSNRILRFTSHIFAISTLAITATSYSKDNRWDADNNPHRLVKGMESNYSRLPLSGSINLEKRGWSDYYWANVTGGIAYRWQIDSFFKENETFSKQKILSMSEKEINKLSPAEKFDILTGQYNFPLTKEERRDNRPGQPEWRGICHGWAPASIQFDEPQPKTVTNVDGVKIPFTSSDIKALLSYYIARVSDADATLVGNRCGMKEGPARLFKTADCGDVHPASFHLILSNKIGIQKQGFLADFDQYKAVWNYAVVSYSSEVINVREGAPAGATPGTRRVVTLETKVVHPGAIDPEPLPVLGNDKKQTWETETYTYTLELNAQDQIIGGEWVNGSKRPDFVWDLRDNHTFKGSWKSLLPLLQ